MIIKKRITPYIGYAFKYFHYLNFSGVSYNITKNGDIDTVH
jgi:hypothetical protein